MFSSMGPRDQGTLGELSAIDWLGHHGYTVYVPVGHAPDVDVVAVSEADGAALKVQVKTSVVRLGVRRFRWEVKICTRGGNQSWNGIVKRFPPDRCDMLFAHVGDGRRWFIPASVIPGGTSVCLGGPTYARWEVDQGEPLPAYVLKYNAEPAAG